MPPNLHSWERFIKPIELQTSLVGDALEQRGVAGLEPRASPPKLLLLLRKRKRGDLDYVDFGRAAS